MTSNLAEILTNDAAALGVQLTPVAVDILLDYLALLDKWNRTYNLVGPAPLDVLLRRHLSDALALVPHVSNGQRIADVGSGAGLPGLVLAICAPLTSITLIEPRHKRAAFLQQAVRSLTLSNVDIINSRVEACHPNPGFDIITSRAFTDLTNFISLTEHCLAPGGRFIAMKGPKWAEESAELTSHYSVGHTNYTLPGIADERALVFVKRTI